MAAARLDVLDAWSGTTLPVVAGFCLSLSWSITAVTPAMDSGGICRTSPRPREPVKARKFLLPKSSTEPLAFFVAAAPNAITCSPVPDWDTSVNPLALKRSSAVFCSGVSVQPATGSMQWSKSRPTTPQPGENTNPMPAWLSRAHSSKAASRTINFSDNLGSA